MSQLLIVLEKVKDWKPYFPTNKLISSEDYLLLNAKERQSENVQVLNLCRSYSYLSIGWYVSLLGESRKDRIFPNIKALQDLSKKSIYSLDLEDLDELVKKGLEQVSKNENFENKHELSFKVFFGRTNILAFEKLARQIFDVYNLPILKIELKYKGSWIIQKVSPCPINILTETEEDQFALALEYFSNKVWRKPKPKKLFKYDLAILHSPDAQFSPSNERALQKFVKIGKELDINVELITKKHYNKLAEYDALFIRETTAVTDHTYRFAKKAASEGMVVIDDPMSILRCTNKIFLANLLTFNQIPHPRTIVLTKDSIGKNLDVLDSLGYPFIFKIPDGAFSKGMAKVNKRSEVMEKSKVFFEQSDLVLAQEFVYTEFDWRIGILNHKIIYACKYFMSRGHWQIVEHKKNGKSSEGAFTAHTLDQVPEDIAKVALKMASCIGDGLYGVDVKETPNGPLIVEINDNPNIDAGVEDKIDGDDLYRTILKDFIRRIEMK